MQGVDQPGCADYANRDIDPEDDAPASELADCSSNRYLNHIIINISLTRRNRSFTPMLVPNAQANAPIARYLGLSRRVVMSLRITEAKTRQPPPPSPS